MKIPVQSLLAVVILAVVLAACSGPRGAGGDTAPAPIVLALIDGQPVTVSEFEEQYVRTVLDTLEAADDSREEYADFLDRYVDFRLKVLEAERLGYGDREDLQQELETYRGQLARPYLLEREVTEPLVRQLYERRTEMIDVSHILLRVDENAPPADTLAVYARLTAIVDSIRQGHDFASMAYRHSEDPSARAAQGSIGYLGRLGFFTAGRMVAPFEDRMYDTPVDSVSDVFRTQFGYHVLKVHGRRTSVPDRRISHIMIQPRSPSAADSAEAVMRIDSVRAALESNEPFASVAERLSNDTQSAQRGGDLDFIAYDGWLPVEMRDVAFAADSVGAVLGPVRTRFGWHFMQVTDIQKRPSLDEAYEGLQAEIARMPRSRMAEQAFARSLRMEHGAQVDSSVYGRLMGTMSADSILAGLRDGTLDPDLMVLPFGLVGDSTWSLEAFSAFISGGGVRLTAASGSERIHQAIAAWLDDRALAYEIAALEDRDAGFARTMRDFRDGLMLFRLMEDSVWTAASTDSVAQEVYFDAHADSFWFGDRHRILSIVSSSDSLLLDIASALDAGATYDDILNRHAGDSLFTVRFDTTLVEGPTDSVFDRAVDLAPGEHTGVVGFGNGRVVLLNDGIESARPKSFEEARAEVVSRVQEALEDRLIRRLRGEHGVQIHYDRLDQVFARYRDASSPTASTS